MRLLIITIYLLFASIASPVSAQTQADLDAVKAAAAKIRAGDIQRGTLEMRALSERGVPQALFLMGEIYKDGIGLDEPSISTATMYYRLASRLGYDKAALKLANILFFEGDESEASYAEAIAAWQELAIKGNAEAAYMLGMVYWNGDAGAVRDPVRGYGLVWLAAEKGYGDAEQNLLSMRGMLNSEARTTGEEYAQNLAERGFGVDPLAMDLVLDSAPKPVSSPAPKEEAPIVKPDDWSTVWRLEVGFAMSELEVTRLQSIIGSTQAQVIGALHSEVIDSANRPGLYRLVYGPVRSMHEAVSKCVALKRAGHDCFAKPPETDE